MANKRVIDMQELSELGDGWYTFLDSAAGGTKKFDMGNMLNATADAQDAAEAAQSAATSAREAADGVVSPTVTPSQITGGTRVTITDVDGTRSFDVMDGPQGEKGDTGDPAAPGSITTDMLADGAVTPDKLAPGITDGHHPSLSAGSATGILGDPETASWMERTTAADGAALIDAIYGNTLRWNQLVTFTAGESTVNGVTCTRSADGSLTYSGTASAGGSIDMLDVNPVNGHMYLYSGFVGQANDRWVNFGGLYPVTSEAARLFIYTREYPRLSLRMSFVSGAVFDNLKFYSQVFDLTAMFGAGNEPSTVAEFEALFPEPYYPYDAGSLLPVRMEGIETVGFNQCPEVWQVGGLAWATGNETTYTDSRRTDFIPALPSTKYYYKGTSAYGAVWYDADKNFIDSSSNVLNRIRTTPAGTRYVRLAGGSTIVDEQACLNLSDPARNGTYEPHWRSERAIPVATYFPDGMRSAGSVADELRADAAVTRVGVVDLGALNWELISGGLYFVARNGLSDAPAKQINTTTVPNAECARYTPSKWNDLTNLSSVDDAIGVIGAQLALKDASYTTVADLVASLAGVYLFYELATPTTTPIDPPLPMSYRVGAGGTERVIVASGTQSAPPVFATRYPLDPADLAASIAPVDGPTAKTNHQVGDLLMLGYTLCKATQVIVTGEVIEIGTNVTRTTVAAELAALSE